MQKKLTQRQQSLIYLALCEKKRHYEECIEQCRRKMITHHEFVQLVDEMEELKAMFDRPNKIIVEV